MAFEIATVSAIFGIARNTKSIAGMLGLVESIDSKINSLMQSKLGAALRSLEQARDTSSEMQREPLLQDARRFFNEALSLEKNERLIVAQLGLAFCHFALGDWNNGLAALKATENINYIPSTVNVAKNVVKFVLFAPFITLPGNTFLSDSDFGIALLGFNNLKNDVRELYEILLNQEILPQ